MSKVVDESKIRALRAIQERTLEEMKVSMSARIRIHYLRLVDRLGAPVKEHFKMKTNEFVQEILRRLTRKVSYSSWLIADCRLLVVHACLEMTKVTLKRAR